VLAELTCSSSKMGWAHFRSPTTRLSLLSEQDADLVVIA
jgi:hypothetical protein